ncbi:MAG: UDP-N-acetylmuramoyl-L-alanyl-D-glutamate--2,6-diaminopimelate ligase [Oscillospiraceae bacterium]|nr:UDP-N-acetylmuramoyl-L-alanyl-D-glutamate--2,6-diaminopimelate ligase [Oscillospiraceae bacterium]
MLLRELIEKVDKKNVCADMDLDMTGVESNSKAVRRGDLFVAVKGSVSDGHDFIKDAVKKGAACVVCERMPDVKIPYILTDNSRKALALISAAWFKYPARKMKLIGVTGTNGKTSVTHLIKHMIEKCSGSKVGLIGTIENVIGERTLKSELTTPDSYAMQSILDKMCFEGCDYAVMEVSSHALDLDRVYGIVYDVGVFTNLTPDHLDFHPTMDEYARVKSSLFTSCRSSIINIDDEYAHRMIERSGGDVMTYAVNDEAASLVGRDIKVYSDKTEFYASLAGKTARVELCIPGMFSVYNALAAMGAGIKLGFGADEIAAALTSCKMVKGRAEILPIKRDYSVLVDYAHTPDALENIIKTARSLTANRVITLFGCGGDRDKAKRPLMGKIASNLSDFVYITSDNPRTEKPEAIIGDIVSGIETGNTKKSGGNYCIVVDRKKAIFSALDSLQTGDMLIIAGKGHETYQIIGTEKIKFDDREAVDDYYRQTKLNERLRQNIYNN